MASEVAVGGWRDLDDNRVEHFICGYVVEGPAEDAEEKDKYEEAGNPGCNYQFVVSIEVSVLV